MRTMCVCVCIISIISNRYLWRVTKNPKWREAGWAIMQAFDRCCKVPSGGYVGLTDVTSDNPEQVWDGAQSIWIM